MKEYKISRETKLLILSIMNAGYCTDQQRVQLAEAFGLFVEQQTVLSEESVRALIEKL